jgi:hypothetical protein
LGAPARNRPLVLGRLTNRDKRPPHLSRFVTRPETKGVTIYKSSDPLALDHFFVPDPPPLSLMCPPPPPSSSSSLTADFRSAPRPLPLGILRPRQPPRIRHPLTRQHRRPPTCRRSAAVGPRNASGFHPDLPRPPGLLLASASSPYSSASSSPTSRAPPPPRASRLATRLACASSPPPTHQHRLSHSVASSCCLYLQPHGCPPQHRLGRPPPQPAYTGPTWLPLDLN